MKDQKNLWSRRKFLGSAALGMAGMVVIPAMASSCRGKAKPVSAEGKDIRLGFIGMGQQSMFLLSGFLQIPGVKVLAGCDVYGIKKRVLRQRWIHMKSIRIFLQDPILMQWSLRFLITVMQ